MQALQISTPIGLDSFFSGFVSKVLRIQLGFIILQRLTICRQVQSDGVVETLWKTCLKWFVTSHGFLVSTNFFTLCCLLFYGNLMPKRIGQRGETHGGNSDRCETNAIKVWRNQQFPL